MAPRAASPGPARRRLLALTGGAVFSSCAVVYAPLLATGVLPLAVALWGPRTPLWQPFRGATLCFLGAAAAGVTAFLAALSAAGLVDSFVTAVGALQSVGAGDTASIYDVRDDFASFVFYRVSRTGLRTIAYLTALFCVFAALGVAWTRVGRVELRLLLLCVAVAGLALSGAAFVSCPIPRRT